jgi:hypothetical protein
MTFLRENINRGTEVKNEVFKMKIVSGKILTISVIITNEIQGLYRKLLMKKPTA